MSANRAAGSARLPLLPKANGICFMIIITPMPANMPSITDTGMYSARLPARMKPSKSWMAPAIKPAHRNSSNEPSSVIAARIIAAKPAAGPETLMCEVLSEPITMPPTMPANTPDNGGAPEASAMPRHNGRATRKTTSPEAKLDLNRLPKGCFF